MASEAIGILISAEDQASAKIAQAASNIDRSVKKIKDVGRNAKASTEFIGQLAGQLGGSEIGAVAGQLGGLTEKISQFSEVSKLGGAGALAFKAGLVGLVGVLSFNVGKTIGNWFFETERWNKELEDATKNAESLGQRLTSLLTDANRKEFSGIQLLQNPQEQEAELKSFFSKIENGLREQVKVANEMEKAIEPRYASSFDNDANVLAIFGVKTATDLLREADEKAVEQRRKSINEQGEQLRLMKEEVAERNRLLQITKEQAAQESGKAFNRSLEQEFMLLTAQGDKVFDLRAEYAGLTGDIAKQASFLMQMIDAEKKRQEAAKKAQDERQREQDRLKAEQERNADFLRGEVESLEERNILLTQGNKAAEVFRLTNRGIAREDAMFIANERERLDMLEKQKNAERATNQPLQAVQSRTLMRGSSEGFQVKIADSTKKASDILAEIKILQQELITATREKKPVEINLEQR